MRALDVAAGVAAGIAIGWALFHRSGGHPAAGAGHPPAAGSPSAPPDANAPAATLAGARSKAPATTAEALRILCVGIQPPGPPTDPPPGSYEALVKAGRSSITAATLEAQFHGDDAAAVRALREALARAKGENDGYAVEGLLKLAREVGTPEAVGLLLEVLAWDDAEADAPHRSEMFESLISELADERIAPALVAKIRANLGSGKQYWHEIWGYARALGPRGSVEGTALLKELFEGKSGVGGQAQVGGLYGLLRSGDPGLFDYLVSANPSVVAQDVSDLLELGEAQILPKMTAYALRRDADPTLRRSFAYQIGLAGGEEAVDFLTRLWDGGLRDAAVGAYAGLPARGLPGAAADRARETLRLALVDADPSVRSNAIETVASNALFHTDDFVARLERLLAAENDKDGQRELRGALSRAKAGVKKQAAAK